ncbi:FkbM family methyltransferase [Pedobacter sp. ASV12]|uniref:FkbM family methyltransferase n=1 Tax=Pedobacter sp. ASV12 TaxID=2795120 RepID=UPI0018EE2DF3|nr:FkbM family methyltransferase [Pedobacter sp. ASV12]
MILHSLIPFKRTLAKLFGIHLKFSFSQMGEDLIVKFILDALKLKQISYLDIGANHPYNMNNTYLFYLLGMRGVCVEPNPVLFKKLKSIRKKDRCLNIGIGTGAKTTGKFFLTNNSLLSTFSEAEALQLEAAGQAKIISSQEVELLNINLLIERYFDTCPDFISLDVEGLDLAILQEFDFGRFRPKIFCIETVLFSNNLKGAKAEDIISLLQQNNYRVFADTYINTIFVDNNLFD